MNDHQPMRNHPDRTRTNASARLGEYIRRGYIFNIQGDDETATVTITAPSGEALHATALHEDIENYAPAGSPAVIHRQSILMAHAIHVACDRIDRKTRENQHACEICGTSVNVSAFYDTIGTKYDWYCVDCIYGTAA